MGLSSKRDVRCTITASAFLTILAANVWAVTRMAGTAQSFHPSISYARAAQTNPRTPTPLERTRQGGSTRAAGARSGRQPALGASRLALRAPADVRFREVPGRGLLVKTWINGAGPYGFAVDTGAGATIISSHVAREARVGLVAGRAVDLSGLSGARGSAREAFVDSIALGESSNLLPARGAAVVADSLPPDLDGVIDPTESYYPLGYVIDFPAGCLRSFDPRTAPLRRANAPPDGDVVAWLMDGDTRRPFVMLEGGRRALLDTGSGFGLALTPEAAGALGVLRDARSGRAGDVRDLGRGRIDSRRIGPSTVRLGALVLRGIPTDLLAGVRADAPILLGRDALRPFEIAFDPVSRLIRFAPY